MVQTAAVINSCIVKAVPLSRSTRGRGPSHNRTRIVKNTRQTIKSLFVYWGVHACHSIPCVAFRY